MTETVSADVPISEIRENPVALRSVDKNDEQYQSLVHDIGRRGLLKPVIVREKVDETDGTNYYELCDGLQRFSAAKDNGMDTIPVRIMSLSDAEVEETQIVANLCKVDTKPVEYSNQLRRMLQRNPIMTEAGLAEMISQSVAFVRQRLNLQKLDPAIQVMVDNGDIVLSNAIALSKLPREEQHNWTDQAMTQSPSEFIQVANARAKEIREAAKLGRSASKPTFTPTKKLRKVREFEFELDSATSGPSICAEVGAETAADGFAACVQWALSLDSASVQAQKDKFDARNKERADATAKRTVVREAKRAKEAAEKAAVAREASGMTDEEIQHELQLQEAAAAEAAVAV